MLFYHDAFSCLLCAGTQVYEKWLWPLPSHLAYFLHETDVPAMMGVDLMARYSQVRAGRVVYGGVQWGTVGYSGLWVVGGEC